MPWLNLHTEIAELFDEMQEEQFALVDDALYQRRLHHLEIQRRYYRRIMADPDRHARYLAKMRAKYRRRMTDPVKAEKHREKTRRAMAKLQGTEKRREQLRRSGQKRQKRLQDDPIFRADYRAKERAREKKKKLQALDTGSQNQSLRSRKSSG